MDNIKLQLTSQHAMLTLSHRTHRCHVMQNVITPDTIYLRTWCHKTEKGHWYLLQPMEGQLICNAHHGVLQKNAACVCMCLETARRR